MTSNFLLSPRSDGEAVQLWLGECCGESRGVGATPTSPENAALSHALAGVSGFTEHRLTPDRLLLAFRAWGEIVGLVNVELLGHFTNAIGDPEAVFASAAEAIAHQTLAD